MKKFLVAFILFCIATLAIAACASGGAKGSASGGNMQVHMSDQNFAQSTVTIHKGDSITLTDDTATPHIIANGTWQNSSPMPMHEQGMPSANNIQISGSGSSQTVGPFMTPGTYHLYCTVHPGMSLTIVVQ
jgi:plastocyanin